MGEQHRAAVASLIHSATWPMLMEASKEQYCFRNLCSVSRNTSEASTATRTDISVMTKSIVATFMNRPTGQRMDIHLLSELTLSSSSQSTSASALYMQQFTDVYCRNSPESGMCSCAIASASLLNSRCHCKCGKCYSHKQQWKLRSSAKRLKSVL